jgi:hypothetical protein
MKNRKGMRKGDGSSLKGKKKRITGQDRVLSMRQRVCGSPFFFVIAWLDRGAGDAKIYNPPLIKAAKQSSKLGSKIGNSIMSRAIF